MSNDFGPQLEDILLTDRYPVRPDTLDDARELKIWHALVSQFMNAVGDGGPFSLSPKMKLPLRVQFQTDRGNMRIKLSDRISIRGFLPKGNVVFLKDVKTVEEALWLARTLQHHMMGDVSVNIVSTLTDAFAELTQDEAILLEYAEGLRQSGLFGIRAYQNMMRLTKRMVQGLGVDDFAVWLEATGIPERFPCLPDDFENFEIVVIRC